MEPVVVNCSSRGEWLEARRTGLGASDAASIVGMGFRGPSDVFYSKRDPAHDGPTSGVLRLGQELEPALMARYAEVMGIEMAPCGFQILRHAERPWQICTPDFKRPDGQLVQGKTLCGFDDEWGESGSDKVPLSYRIQVTQEAGVAGTDLIDLAALCRITGQFRVYRIAFDVVLFDWITQAEADFWSLVESNTPPPPDWADRFIPDVAALRDDDTPDLGDDVAELVARMKQFSALRDEARDEYDRLKAKVEEAMGEFAAATAGSWKLKRTMVKASTYTAHRKAGVRLDVRLNKERSMA